MDFATLKDKLRQTLGRDAVDLAYTLASDELSKRLKLVSMDKLTTVVANSGAIPLPSDLQKINALYLDSPREYFSPTTFEGAASGASARSYVVFDGSAIITGAIEDGTALELSYKSSLGALVDGADTNAALEDAPEAFIYSVLKHHSRLIRNYDAAVAYEGIAEGAIASANDDAKAKRFSGGLIEPTVRDGVTVV